MYPGLLPTFRPPRLGRGGRFFPVGTLQPWLGSTSEFTVASSLWSPDPTFPGTSAKMNSCSSYPTALIPKERLDNSFPMSKFHASGQDALQRYLVTHGGFPPGPLFIALPAGITLVESALVNQHEPVIALFCVSRNRGNPANSFSGRCCPRVLLRTSLEAARMAKVAECSITEGNISTPCGV
jgi:hypothetical protein